MQSNPPAANGNKKTIKTMLIIGMFAFLLVFISITFIMMGTLFFPVMLSPPYLKMTAKAQSEIIEIKPHTWRETNLPGEMKGTHEVNGYSISYKFTTADGHNIFQTDDKHRSNDPSDIAQVCYDPNNPSFSELTRAGNCP